MSDTTPMTFLAQAADELPVTAGTIVGVILVLCALTGSLSVIALWWSRIAAGRPMIAQANRPPLQIPLPLTGIGLLIACLMAALTLAVSVGTVESVVAPPPKNGAAAEAAEVGKPADDSSSGSSAATARLISALSETVRINIMLLIVLGIPVILLKQKQIAEYTARTVTRDATSAAAMAAAPVSTNPYDASATAARAGSASMPVEVSGGDPAHHAAPELWRFGPELRCAGETCLAAWLPTAILRITLVLFLGDDAQHPFLQLIKNGVGWQILLLIAFTAVVLAPLMEELLYRVIILGGLLHATGDLTPMSRFGAIGVSSFLFAFAHGFPDSLALLPLAFALAWTYHQRRSYRTVVLVHSFFNGFNILLAGVGLL